MRTGSTLILLTKTLNDLPRSLRGVVAEMGGSLLTDCGWETNVSNLDLSIRVGDMNKNKTWTLKMFGKKEAKRLGIRVILDQTIQSPSS